ncbi:FxDxF family PEP-CTERM protein [Roseateles terrae]|uniref:Ice-binding protein C-terminal domain-containing protein n=1 Tax=Roseateles terrae TaxID=431060 RepID=A0ABR6GY73_9BURK|nr:FxDxF family PEP-CTERM protein [Roseateles terrae]MBB3197062.1 hypothetical protein [Roseateles terrae]OWQ84224.1 hypothetical protein CDN98_19785 [Roseateles terrae]
MTRFTASLIAAAGAGLLALSMVAPAAAKSVDVALITGTDGSSYTGAEPVEHFEVGSFTDTFHLNLTGPSLVEVGLITIGASDDQFITFTKVLLNGVPVSIQTDLQGDGTRSSLGYLAQAGLSGAVTLTVEGYAGGSLPVGSGIGASYTGTFNVLTSAVPEPASAALLLAGLGAVGLVARRRRRV